MLKFMKEKRQDSLSPNLRKYYEARQEMNDWLEEDYVPEGTKTTMYVLDLLLPCYFMLIRSFRLLIILLPKAAPTLNQKPSSPEPINNPILLSSSLLGWLILRPCPAVAGPWDPGQFPGPVDPSLSPLVRSPFLLRSDK